MKLRQINKIYKCPKCKNTYLERILKNFFNNYCCENREILKCNKCFGEWEEYEQK
jgi:ribosomal protein L37AE/L43A